MKDCFDLPKNVGNNLKDEINFIIKNNECLAEYKIKNGISQLLFKYKHVYDTNSFSTCHRD